jgi:HlyD family secretion protein
MTRLTLGIATLAVGATGAVVIALGRDRSGPGPGPPAATAAPTAPTPSPAADPGPTDASTSTSAIVNGIKAVLGDVSECLNVTGTVKARDEVNIAAEVGATVEAVTVQEGDFVERGKVIIRLDASQSQAQLTQAEASVALAEARLRQAQHGRSLQTSESETQIAQAQSQLDAARAKLGQARTATQLQGDSSSAQIEQARAALTAAQAQLSEVKRGAREQDRRRAELLVDQAKVVYDVMEQGLERRKKLLAAGGISADDFASYASEYEVRKSQYHSAKEALSLTEEGATTEQITMAESQVKQADEALRLALANRAQTEIRQRDVDAAQAAVEQATEALRLARASKEQIDVRQEDIAAADAGLRQARAPVDLAQTQLSKSMIRAPITGLVSARLVDPGELVGPGVGVMQLVDIGYVEVYATVNEVQIRKLLVGQPAEVTVDALPGRTFLGPVTDINPSTIPNQRFFIVKVRLPNPKGVLRPGMFARICVTLEERKNVVLVPDDAIVTKDGATVVFVARGGVAKLEPVQRGLSRDAQVEVIGNVRAGEMVIISGQSGLEDGMPVEVREARF